MFEIMQVLKISKVNRSFNGNMLLGVDSRNVQIVAHSNPARSLMTH